MARKTKDIKFQMYISEKMDDSIVQVSELMGISKSEFVRMCVAQTLFGYNKGVEMAKEICEEKK